MLVDENDLLCNVSFIIPAILSAFLLDASSVNTKNETLILVRLQLSCVGGVFEIILTRMLGYLNVVPCHSFSRISEAVTSAIMSVLDFKYATSPAWIWSLLSIIVSPQ